MKILKRIFYGVFGILFLSGIALFALPSLPYIGHYEVKIVKSGSMEPTIHTGAIVVIRHGGPYAQNDVVTFTSASADIPTTHRIVGAVPDTEELLYVTKGDANEEADAEPLSPEMIVGKVLFSVPYVGFLLDFARQPLGFGLLIGIPAFLIIIDEVDKIWREIKNRRRKDEGDDTDGGNPILTSEMLVTVPQELQADSKKYMDIRIRKASVPYVPRGVYPKRAPSRFGVLTPVCVSMIFAICVVQMGTFGTTLSYMSDFEFSEMNTLVAQALGFTASPDETTFTFENGVLINSDGELVTLIAPEEGSVDMKYALSVASTSGSTAFCNAITAEVLAPFAYSGPLLGLSVSDVMFDTAWSFVVGLLPGTYAPGEYCEVKLTYHAWNALYPQVADGYDDEETVTLTFSTPIPLGARLFTPLADESLVVPIVENATSTGEEEPEPEDTENTGTTTEDVTPLDEEVSEETASDTTDTVSTTETEQENEPEEVVEEEPEPEVESTPEPVVSEQPPAVSEGQ